MHLVPYLIGIAGPSCSGKTTLAEQLGSILPSSVLISLDAYYRDLSYLNFEERCQRNFDTPEALDWDLLIAQLTALAHGREIQQPVYSFSTHSRTSETRRIQPEQFVIIEGLFTLHREEVRRLLHTKVFLALNDDICLARRLRRDTTERDRSADSVVAQYTQTVRPMGERYVLPTQSFADLVLFGTASAGKLGSIVSERLSSQFSKELRIPGFSRRKLAGTASGATSSG
jgi:uridine kinase